MALPIGSDSLPPTPDSDSLRPKGIPSVRRLLWLLAGMLFGVLLGFVFGLARPRARK